MNTHYQNYGNYGILECRGALMGEESTTALLNGIESHVIEYECKKIAPLILDLYRTSLISAAWLSRLISATKMLREKDSDIKLCNLNDRTYNLFAIMKLDNVFEIYPTLEEAVESLELESKVVQRKV